jgi:5'(3')-deoxyribonucleotidase
MRFNEFNKSKPILYVDMDGVQCDFFGAWAKLHNKSRYKEIGDKETRELSIHEMNKNGPEWVKKFFATLPPIPEGLNFVKWLVYTKTPYTILSSPLRGNVEASIEGKKIWLQKYTPWALNNAIFMSEKSNLAKKGDSSNILVDDYKKNINSWDSAGGIGMLFRVDRVDTIKKEIIDIYKEYR